MARSGKNITSAEAGRMIAAHRGLMTELERVAGFAELYRQNIVRASEQLISNEVFQTLKSIPVEELNRNRQGIRVKILRENHYNTVADLAAVPLQTIIDLKGIGDEMALQIQAQVRDFSEKIRKETRIRLSADNRTPENFRLISSIYLYQKNMPQVSTCQDILMQSKQTVESAIAVLTPVTSGLKWFFASRQKKEQAAEVYACLNTMLNGAYGQRSRAVLSYLKRTQFTADQEVWNHFLQNPIGYANILEQLNPGILGTDDEKYGLPAELAESVQKEEFKPAGLHCTLRRYQEWGVRYILHQRRVLLGDEMGLGKTIQAIAVMVSLRNAGEGHFLVVCPASVISNWCREIQKHSTLTAFKIHGPQKEELLQEWLKQGGVGVTTYETTGAIELTEGFSLGLLIVDEAHYIKNPQAQRSIRTRELCTHADRLLFMTGTALENRIDEMIGLIGVLQPEIAAEAQKYAFMSDAKQFQQIIAPVYYRRKREDVLTELPELIEKQDWCTLSNEELTMYEMAVFEGNYAAARRVSWNIADVRRSSKAKRLMEIAEEAESDGRKLIVFSFFLDTIQKVCTLFGDRCLPPVTGAVSPENRQKIIDEFGKAPAGTILPAQIQAGGTGLNIQTASVVVICEPQFKPSIENQAISRAYRMGQARNVLVHRLLCEDTVDERITALLAQKQAVFDAFADESAAVQQSGELDEKSFRSMMQEEEAHIRERKRLAGEQIPGQVS